MPWPGTAHACQRGRSASTHPAPLGASLHLQLQGHTPHEAVRGFLQRRNRDKYPVELSWINTDDPQCAVGDQNTPRPCGGLRTRVCHGAMGRRWGNAQVGFVPVAGATHHTGLLDHHLPHLQEAEAAVNLWVRGAGSAQVLMEKGNPRVNLNSRTFPCLK